jgi:4-hydroxy-3-methylbut-2-enyl diphosphate reductase
VPEELVTAVLDKLAGHGFGDVEEVEAVEEHMTFALPRELRAARSAEATGAAAPAGPAGPAGSGSRQPG